MTNIFERAEEALALEGAVGRELVAELLAEAKRLRTVLAQARWGTDLAKAHYDTNIWSGSPDTQWEKLSDRDRGLFTHAAWPWADAVALLDYQEENDA